MTGHELKIYLSSLSVIQPSNDYLVESVDGVIIDSEVPIYWKTHISRRLNVEIELTRYSDQQDIFVDFTLGGNNVYACYKLKYITLPMLIESLHDVIRDGIPEFDEWSKTELRNYKINNILYE